MIRYFIISVLVLMPNLISATNLYGIYVKKSYSCDKLGIYSDGVISIKGNEFYLDEMSCTLQSETSVRGMDASLFDAECFTHGSEDDKFGYRVMFMKNMDKSIYMVVDGWVGEYLRCK